MKTVFTILCMTAFIPIFFSQSLHLIDSEGNTIILQDNGGSDGANYFKSFEYSGMVHLSDVTDISSQIDGWDFNSSGKTFEPWNDNTISLGNSIYRWTSVWATNGTIQTSDANLKTNIEPSQYGLNEVLKMKPVTYKWKKEYKGQRKIGFLAQDMLDIVPEIVIKSSGLKKAKTIGGKKSAKPSDAVYGMNYSDLIPVLTKAIQEQQKTIVQHKNENQILKARLDKIEAMLDNEENN